MSRAAPALLLLALTACPKEAPPEPAPPAPRAEVTIRGGDGVPLLRLVEREGALALVDLAGQVVGLRSTTAAGFEVRDRFNEPFCEATRASGGFAIKAQEVPLEATETAGGIRVVGPGLERVLGPEGVASAGLQIAREAGGFAVIREDATVFTVEGPLDPRAALALAIGELPFPQRVCLALVVDELD